MTTKATAKMAKAVYMSGNVSLILASTMFGMSSPVMTITAVPQRELNVPPNWMSWLPLLPPPPRRLSMGLTTVLRRHMLKPATKAPMRYTAKLPTRPEHNWMATPTKPTATAMRAVVL